MATPIYKTYFKDKKITIMGLGLLGRGINVAKFLAENGAILTVTDLKTADQLALSLKQLAKFSNIKYTLGEHKLEDFQKADLVIKAAGVPLDSIYITEAEKNNIPVEMDASLFAKLAPEGVTIVGITGTRGKSTTTHLIYAILQAAKKRAFLGGNVRGLATLPLLKKVKAGDVAVMELDSWQSQGFGDNHFSPPITVFTTFMHDHQNYYKNDMNQYFTDKANLYLFQKPGDILIVGSQAAPLIKKDPKRLGKLISPKLTEVKSWKLKMPGEHNLYNAALAREVGLVLGVPEKVIKKAVTGFPGLDGRLQLVREVKGIKYYNDTTATSPDGLFAALTAFPKAKGRIILLGGGNDANLDLSHYIKKVTPVVKKLILFKGTATEKILLQLPKKSKFEVVVVDSMVKAMIEAKAVSKKGDIVLLSPGAKSFGVFQNEYDRGDQFVKLVKKLK